MFIELLETLQSALRHTEPGTLVKIAFVITEQRLHSSNKFLNMSSQMLTIVCFFILYNIISSITSHTNLAMVITLRTSVCIACKALQSKLRFSSAKAFVVLLCWINVNVLWYIRVKCTCLILHDYTHTHLLYYDTLL